MSDNRIATKNFTPYSPTTTTTTTVSTQFNSHDTRGVVLSSHVPPPPLFKRVFSTERVCRVKSSPFPLFFYYAIIKHQISVQGERETRSKYIAVRGILYAYICIHT